MSIRLWLRIAVIIELVSIFGFIFIDTYLSNSLPSILQDYLNWKEVQHISSFEVGLLFLVLPLLLLYVISAIGLLFLKPWAKKIYIIANILMIVLSPFTGPTVEHAFTSTIGDVESMCFGFIVALLLFTDVLPQNRNA